MMLTSDITLYILALFAVFALGMLMGIFIVGRAWAHENDNDNDNDEHEYEEKPFSTRKTKSQKAQRPDVQAAYKYSSPLYRKEREASRNRTKVGG